MPLKAGLFEDPRFRRRTFAQRADPFAALLDVLGVEKVVVVGASAGGPPAYEFAMRHADRTAALITVDAIGCCYPVPEKAGKVAQALFMSNPGLWFGELLAVNFPRPIIKQILSTEGYITTKQLKESVSHVLGDTGKLEFVVDFFRTMNPYKPRKEGTDIDLEQGAEIEKLPLERVKAPALVIHGKKDADVKFGDGEYAAATIPNAEHFWIEEGTHLGFWLSDQAEEAQGLAVAFFRKHLRNS